MIDKDKVIEQLRQENQQLHETVHFLYSKMDALPEKPAKARKASQHSPWPPQLGEKHPFQAAEATERHSQAKHQLNRNVQLLARVCHELQQIQGNDPFWLSCRHAGAVLGVSHTQTARYIHRLVLDGILRVVEEHTSNRATRYRYVEI
jgi:hypothetical protein